MDQEALILPLWFGSLIVLFIGAYYLYNKLGKIPPSE